MEINLYPGNNPVHLEYHTDFLTENNIDFNIQNPNTEKIITIYADSVQLKAVSAHLCNFMVIYYLNEAVLSKLYDEYPCFNTDEAGQILSAVSEKIKSVSLCDNIYKLICNKKIFKPESYVIFNINSLMNCVYALTDETAGEYIYIKEKERLISAVRFFSELSFDKCNRADVEFSSDDDCMVSFDKGDACFVKNDELIAFLVGRSPRHIHLKNWFLNPELSSLLSKIFKVDKA